MPSITAPVALIGSAAIGGISSAVGAGEQASAAKSAAQTQANAAEQSALIQQQMYDQTVAREQPYVSAGNNALAQLMSGLGLGAPPSASNPASMAGGAGAGGPLFADVGGRQIQVGGASPTNPVSGTSWINTAGGNPQLEVWDASSGRYGIANPNALPSWLNGQSLQSIIGSAKPQSAPNVASPGAAGGPAGGIGGGAPGLSFGSLTAPVNLPSFDPNLTAPFDPSKLDQTPGYQFTLNQGLQGVIDSKSATGGVGGGNTLKALTQYGQGLASTTYNQQLQNYLSQQLQNYNITAGERSNIFDINQAQNQQLFNFLQTIAGSGQNAAANLGSLGSATAGNIGNDLIGAGNATAAGTIGAANATTGLIGNLNGNISNLTNNYLLASMLGQGGGSGYLPGSAAYAGGGFGGGLPGDPTSYGFYTGGA